MCRSLAFLDISDVRPATASLDDKDAKDDDQDKEVCSKADSQHIIPRVARTRKPPDRFWKQHF